MSAEFRVWQCSNCGDLYSEAEGMPAFGIAPGTRFEDLPDDWVCPACGAPKSDYVVMDG